MKLPPAATNGAVSVEAALQRRRTVRTYGSKALDLPQVAQLMWAAQGITGKGGFKRTAPSAGALYPMDVYAVVGETAVHTLDAGIYHYAPENHALALVAAGDFRTGVAGSCLSQQWMAQAPLHVVITAEYDRARRKYGQRAVRYAMIEAGHIGQNLYLQAEALGLRAGIVGAFNDRDLQRVMQIPPAHEPLLVMPVGYGDR
ncbi:MAG TPA: SagB/ThcOx family dehydrogenase [Desulfosarcina sp.]|nr:SagB/ThcOx family dehydrogenase [Desulfosarcina sp.]